LIQAERGDAAAAPGPQGTTDRMITAGNEAHASTLRGGEDTGQCQLQGDSAVGATGGLCVDGASVSPPAIP
jgi:hypothetical protein